MHRIGTAAVAQTRGSGDTEAYLFQVTGKVLRMLEPAALAAGNNKAF
jgi:hypothetical protein